MIRSIFNFKDAILTGLTHLKHKRYFQISSPELSSALSFVSDNYVTQFRYDTFFEKEPETLQWLRNIESGSTLWDIGANVGLYSIYYLALNPLNRVVAFEPHPGNLYPLIENLKRNSFLGERITIVPTPLYSSLSMLKFSMNSVSVGDSNHTVSSNTSNPFYLTPTLTLNSFATTNNSCPDYIKLDVDGNELDILSAAEEIFNNKKLKGIIMEVDFADLKEVNGILQIMNKYGFSEESRYDGMEKYGKVSSKKLFNVIYKRK